MDGNERDDAIAALRELCAEHGCNDWADDTPIGAIVRDHLAPALHNETVLSLMG